MIRPWSENETVSPQPASAFSIEKYYVSRPGFDSNIVLHLPRKMTRLLNPRHKWNVIYNERSAAPATQSDTWLYCTWLYSTLLYSAGLYFTWPYATWLYSAWLYHTWLYSTWPYSTWLYSTWNYSTCNYSTWSLFLINIHPLLSPRPTPEKSLCFLWCKMRFGFISTVNLHVTPADSGQIVMFFHVKCARPSFRL